MKTDYLKFTEGEITVYCGDHARANVHSSLQQAREIAASSRQGKIMYVNTVFSTRKLLEAARRELGDSRTDFSPSVKEGDGRTKVHPTKEIEGIFFKHVIIGDLCKYLGEIREMIEANDIKYLIVNSWDFANRSYGYKEKALFGLMNIANELGISVLIYSQARMRGAVAGEMHRTGLGKLAAVADAIIWTSSDDILDEIRDQERKVKILSDRKINELSYARSESGISAGGELVLPDSGGGIEVLEEDLVFA
jgi:hypothetical protein